MKGRTPSPKPTLRQLLPSHFPGPAGARPRTHPRPWLGSARRPPRLPASRRGLPSRPVGLSVCRPSVSQPGRRRAASAAGTPVLWPPPGLLCLPGPSRFAAHTCPPLSLRARTTSVPAPGRQDAAAGPGGGPPGGTGDFPPLTSAAPPPPRGGGRSLAAACAHARGSSPGGARARGRLRV